MQSSIDIRKLLEKPPLSSETRLRVVINDLKFSDLVNIRNLNQAVSRVFRRSCGKSRLVKHYSFPVIISACAGRNDS